MTIRSWPAIHAGDGPVSFALEYKGLKIVIGGDTYPNKWYVKYATNADVAIHETFLTPDQLVKLYNQSPRAALGVGTQIHTAPPAFGKVMSTIKPRHAIGYHFFNEEATRYAIHEGVRETYDGPLSLAVDNMVWNPLLRKTVRFMTSIPTEHAICGIFQHQIGSSRHSIATINRCPILRLSIGSRRRSSLGSGHEIAAEIR